MNEQNQGQTPSTREQQLELQIWMEHKNALIAKGQALQAQAQLIQAQTALLQAEGKETEANIARLQAVLAPKAAEKSDEPAEPVAQAA